MPRILIADDEMYQRLLMRTTLEDEMDIEIREAVNGQDALDMATTWLPDLILLDIMMPLVDGLEVCEQLRNQQSTFAIPIILVTALGGRGDKVRGLNVGADDFITKPFEPTELLARVRSNLRSKMRYDQVVEYVRQLEQLDRTKRDLIDMVMHDIGNVTQIMLSYINLAKRMPESRVSETLNTAQDAARQLIEMVGDTLDLGRIESASMPLELEPLDLDRIISNAFRSFAAIADEQHIQLQMVMAQNLPIAFADRRLIQRVLGNLIGNALRHAPTSTSVEVLVSLYPRESAWLMIQVRDYGPGIPPEAQEIIFQKYEQAALYRHRETRYGHGIGLTFCKMAVEVHGGHIWVESEIKQGSTFSFTLPTYH